MHRSPRPSRFAPHAAVALAAAFVVLAVAPTAFAQTPAELRRRGFEPVDMQIADVDPLRRSIRKVAPGLGPIGQESAVYRRTDGSDDRLYLVTPRFTASYDRSQYLALVNGRGDRATAMMVPPNTVFHIGRPARGFHEQVPAPDHPARINSRLDPDTPGAVDVNRPTPLDAWAAFNRAKHAHRRDVLSALDRAAQP